jgi:hypothetical protein
MVKVPNVAVWIATVRVVELYVQLEIMFPSLSTLSGVTGTFMMISDGPVPTTEKTILLEEFSTRVADVMVELKTRYVDRDVPIATICSWIVDGVAGVIGLARIR